MFEFITMWYSLPFVLSLSFSVFLFALGKLFDVGEMTGILIFTHLFGLVGLIIMYISYTVIGVSFGSVGLYLAIPLSLIVSSTATYFLADKLSKFF